MRCSVSYEHATRDLTITDAAARLYALAVASYMRSNTRKCSKPCLLLQAIRHDSFFLFGGDVTAFVIELRTLRLLRRGKIPPIPHHMDMQVASVWSLESGYLSEVVVNMYHDFLYALCPPISMPQTRTASFSCCHSAYCSVRSRMYSPGQHIRTVTHNGSQVGMCYTSAGYYASYIPATSSAVSQSSARRPPRSP